jgi:hypothetical protein
MKSKKRLVDKIGAAIHAKKSSNSTAAAHNAITINDDIRYSTMSNITIWTVYVFFVECQT